MLVTSNCTNEPLTRLDRSKIEIIMFCTLNVLAFCNFFLITAKLWCIFLVFAFETGQTFEVKLNTVHLLNWILIKYFK